MALFKCKMCGGTLEIKNETVAECEYCGTQQTLPKLDDERRTNLYDRANHFRRNNEFDKAMVIYEQILNEDNTDAESYWSLVLCRYGIEYVEDPSTHKRVPTVNRAQFTSIFDDDNYKAALSHADGYQKTIYEAEARAINEIQKGILAISQKEEPFDVFICYKETDNSGRRTPDSVLANDLYHQLTQEGFKVFFSRITLEDKLGSAYEPYIFAALNSAKVMVVLGTKPEYFKAVWVRNEWSRYLSLIKGGAKKVLIPAYKDMDPYDLPDEFSHLQAQDMSKLGFMQDLIRGINKIVTDNKQKTAARETAVVSAVNGNSVALLKRVFMYLEDGAWQSADEYCERVLDADPENAEAYIGKLMAELKCSTRQAMGECAETFADKSNYQKAYRFGSNAIKNELTGYTNRIIYTDASKQMRTASSEDAYKVAAKRFSSISGYEDAEEKAAICLEKAEIARKDTIYKNARTLLTSNDEESIQKAISSISSILDWKDSQVLQENLQKHLKNVIKENKASKRRKIIIAAVVTIGIVALISIWASNTTKANAERAEIIEQNLVGEVLSNTEYDNNIDSWYGGFRSTIKDKYTFKENNQVEVFWSYETNWEGEIYKDLDDTYNESTDIRTYDVRISLFGKVSIVIGTSTYELNVDENNNVRSMTRNDEVFD